MNDKENFSAYWDWWFRHYRHKEADKFIEPLLKIEIPEQKNWLKFCREALLLSTNEVAWRMKTTTQAYTRFERNFENGKGTLTKIKHAAEAMDCELVFMIRPKKKMSFSRVVWSILSNAGMAQRRFQNCQPPFKARVLTVVSRKLMENASFRSTHGWNRRKGYKGES